MVTNKAIDAGTELRYLYETPPPTPPEEASPRARAHWVSSPTSSISREIYGSSIAGKRERERETI